MIRDMALRGFSPRTHESYVAAVVRLAKYYHRSPDQLTDEEVQAYLAHLIQERKLAWSTCSQAAHAFRFLYHVTLGRSPVNFHVPAPKQLLRVTGIDIERCPVCQQGLLHQVERLAPAPAAWDTS